MWLLYSWCPVKNTTYRKEVSVFKDTFYSYISENKFYRGLSYDKILKLIFYYFKNEIYGTLIEFTGIKAKSTIVNRSNYIREEVTKILNLTKIGGPNSIVQADETLMRGRRKYK